ncbi:DegT/DnrJ/EryC1/StrS family aminotransferase [Spartinivicinus poritis]|uniref:DegT/DnrJ/EryC1/StrS family aminotransferase n=1 Tax=Spartinivicinus poritis TaxID=2994640 RepID=A0ABT5UAY0_9GAMM|nr:DegT/DnrJ/EryC1/StrS family aminotransferase [Spartinivicinus sp. A2-2]MDE1463525.1 DegT/DnrJ/EryC1/StrS family aminotransferase [Spartinivicinus sp. A2-2]
MIPFIDLKAQQAIIKDQLNQRISDVLNHNHYILGPEVSELERQLADYCQVEHVISCASGTDALILALYALQVKPGDVIITTPYSFFATAEAIALVGGIPLFCDVNPDDFNLDATQLEVVITDFYNQQQLLPKSLQQQLPDKPRVAGIITVDLFGLPCHYSAINQLAHQYNLFVIADAAQSFGASINKQKVGSLASDITTTSFFPTKPLGCYGDGGALFTNNEKLASTLRSIHLHGQGPTRAEHIQIGLNSRLDTLQAAILLEKLTIFPQELQQRQRIADYYQTACKHINLATQGINTPSNESQKQSAWAQFTVKAKQQDQRSAICNALKMNKIPYQIYYPIPLHLQPAFHYLGYQPGDLPMAEQLANTLFSLPMHPYLEAAVIDQIVKVIKSTSR